MLGNFPTKEHYRQRNQLSLKPEPAKESANNTYSSGPRLPDSESSNRFWISDIERYMSHFMPEPADEYNNIIKNASSVIITSSRKTSPNYYSDMKSVMRILNRSSHIATIHSLLHLNLISELQDSSNSIVIILYI